jgi:hypothetical protein
MREVICPACGGLIEQEDDDALYRAARLHTLEVHGYDVPREHLLQAATDAD